MNKKIYHAYICDDEVGEVEGFFSQDGKRLASWPMNDGNWRSEYFDPLLDALGFTVEYTEGHNAFTDQLKAIYK